MTGCGYSMTFQTGVWISVGRESVVQPEGPEGDDVHVCIFDVVPDYECIVGSLYLFSCLAFASYLE